MNSRLRLIVTALTLATFATSVSAQLPIRTVANLPAALCTSGELENKVFIASDGLTTIDCTTGGGTAAVHCVCDAGVFRPANASLEAVAATDFVPVTKAGQQSSEATGAGNDWTRTATDDVTDVGNDIIETGAATAVRTAPTQTYVASTSALFTTPILGVSGAYERKVTNVTVADDAAGTKPAGVTPITTDFVTCTCNDSTGCAMSVAEPTVTSGYGRSLTIVSVGTGNCEYADSAGVTEIGAAVVLEPTSVLALVYANAAWHRLSTADNVP